MDFSSRISNDWVCGPVVGKGSTMTVSLETSPITGDVFAVKSSDLSYSAPLQLEKSFLSSIPRSPHIISYLSFHATPSSYNLFLEFATGSSLADKIRRNGKGLPECEIRGYTWDILMGLSHLHSCGITHCDVMPRNVLLEAEDTAKIADLRCSMWTNELKEGKFGNFNGTPMFNRI